MTKADAIRDCLRKVLAMSTDEQLAKWLLSAARNGPCDVGEIYALWCDNQGACKGRDFESLDECCSDEEHIACILRFLQKEYT